ncbi:MAG: hypothetical protein MI867_11120 [Pseudomonadales bacterium]|nr:hypothetical protein [Pseudomonadales bacterium]
MNIDRATEMRRLSRLLQQDEDSLDYLSSLDGAGLQKVRNLIQNSLIDEFSPLFTKIAASGKLAPDSLSALLARKVFGPTLTANIGYYTATKKVVKMASMFDTEFLSDVAREQVPERAQDMLKALPVDVMRGVTRNLLQNKDYHIMGDFTDYLPEDKVRTLMEEISDPTDHLRVSSYAQRKDRIAHLTISFDDDMLKDLIVAAFSHDDLLQEVSLVIAAMQANDQKRMAKLTDEVNSEYRSRVKNLLDEKGIEGNFEAYFAA